MSLLTSFLEINNAHFDGFLDPPQLAWNSRLRTSAGRFIPGSRKFIMAFPPKIEIASYLSEEENAESLIYDTLAHEMIHYWLWVLKRPYGHTPEFLAKMKEMGVSRYNPVPRLRPYKYLYQCRICKKDFPARKKLGPLACASCCKQHAGGRYDPRFQLILSRRILPTESIQLIQQNL
jgi:predicted SprT family Zn-dependent metalloprotease